MKNKVELCVVGRGSRWHIRNGNTNWTLCALSPIQMISEASDLLGTYICKSCLRIKGGKYLGAGFCSSGSIPDLLDQSQQ